MGEECFNCLKKQGENRDKSKNGRTGPKIITAERSEEKKKTLRRSVGSCLWEKAPPAEGLRCFSQKQQKVKVS